MPNNILRLEFLATECNGYPKLKFYIDEQLHCKLDIESAGATVELSLANLSQGRHELKIELYDKTFDHTELVDGKICRDQLATLDEIYVDDVRLPTFLKYQGVYHVGDNKHPQVLTWGQNGHWIWSFECPIIDWILDAKQAIDYEKLTPVDFNNIHMTGYSPAKQQILLDGFSELEKLLNDNKI